MTPDEDGRPSGSYLPETQAGGALSPGGEQVSTDDVGTGVREWLARVADPPAPEGEVLPQDEAGLGPEEDQEQVARTILLDQLTGRARSRSELAEKLRRKDVPDDVAERLLTRFEEVGLVDDEAFARSWVQSRQTGKGLARRALAQELRRKGVADEVARDVLDEVDPDDERESARQLVRKKMRGLQRVDRATAVRRLTGALARKGHPPGVAFEVVREELDAAAMGEESAAEAGYDPFGS